MNICKSFSEILSLYLCIHNYTYGYSSAKIYTG